MRLSFTKMHGAGNDLVLLDGVRQRLDLTAAQLRRLGDRRFGVGADQILVIEPATASGIDFNYRIFNGADGSEVEHCGNGARCFARYVHDAGLTTKTRISVQTVNRVLTLQLHGDGGVTVDMGAPRFEPAELPFDCRGLQPRIEAQAAFWALEGGPLQGLEVMALSMGNPHAVLRVADVEAAPVATLGPLVERHARFPRGVNVGFVQLLSRRAVRLRVFERSAGETLACGTGACAAVVAGISAGWLDARVAVATRGGELQIEWAGPGTAVQMTGPAVTVFQGEIEL